MTETSTSSKRSIPKLVGYFVAIVVLVVIDQWTKFLVLRDRRTLFLAVITALVLCIAIGLLALEKIPGVLNQVAVLLMVAGGFGNLIDRVSRHYVVDFIEVLFTRFAVFNFADCCVTIGAVILILSTILSFVKDVKSSRD